MKGRAVASQRGALAASRDNGNSGDSQGITELQHRPAVFVIGSKLAIKIALRVFLHYT